MAAECRVYVCTRNTRRVCTPSSSAWERSPAAQSGRYCRIAAKEPPRPARGNRCMYICTVSPPPPAPRAGQPARPSRRVCAARARHGTIFPRCRAAWVLHLGKIVPSAAGAVQTPSSWDSMPDYSRPRASRAQRRKATGQVAELGSLPIKGCGEVPARVVIGSDLKAEGVQNRVAIGIWACRFCK